MKSLINQSIFKLSLNLKKQGKIKRIMLTGSNGQLGCGLQPHLDSLYGSENVLYTDMHENSKKQTKIYNKLNCNDEVRLKQLVKEFKPDLIIHLAAILSASGERNPELAYSVNCDSFKKVIDVCKDN
jgi:dTDP-4-dehydrorhamnose reductase